jgi:hypothetical protein
MDYWTRLNRDGDWQKGTTGGQKTNALDGGTHVKWRESWRTFTRAKKEFLFFFFLKAQKVGKSMLIFSVCKRFTLSIHRERQQQQRMENCLKTKETLKVYNPISFLFSQEAKNERKTKSSSSSS